ncbi:hypothetical protein [Paraburkholderia sp. A3RO-2L]|uniref:hypothetical protein n=1 Tax=unclassified Paraburkholderia TaxID=2615204 RepID=UPI0032F69C81|nr:hypothetical protein [Burkholderia vietnamiensis]
MAITVQILEGTDVLQPTDWVRPLLGSGYVDSFMTFSGAPENNLRWVPASDVLGPHYMDMTLDAINADMAELGGWPYEVVRGPVPVAHIWDWRAERKP